MANKFIATGFNINSELISKFFESIEGIEKHIEKIMNLKLFWNNYTTLSCDLEALDANLADNHLAAGCVIIRNSVKM